MDWWACLNISLLGQKIEMPFLSSDGLHVHDIYLQNAICMQHSTCNTLRAHGRSLTRERDISEARGIVA